MMIGRPVLLVCVVLAVTATSRAQQYDYGDNYQDFADYGEQDNLYANYAERQEKKAVG